jgi:hypothetical protein
LTSSCEIAISEFRAKRAGRVDRGRILSDQAVDMVRRETGSNQRSLPHRVIALARSLCVLAGALVALTCGTTSRTSTGPTPLKCQPSVALSTQSIGAVGGSGALSVTTTADCAWSVASEVSWISSLSPAAGQGSAQVTFSVASNPEASTRQGDLVVNDQRIHVRQEAAACRFGIAPKSRALTAEGQEWEVSVTAVAGCTWRATSNAAWMSIKSGATGTRDGVVVVLADSNASQDPRTGSVSIAGETFAVAQAGTATTPPPAPPPQPSPAPAPPPPPEIVCSYTLSPSTHSAPAGGGAGSTSIETNHPGCVWSLSSDSTWLTSAVGVGVGSQSIAFNVAANTGAARTGHLTIGGQSLTVTQAAGSTPGPGPCSYSINPTSLNAAAAGVNGSSIVVTAGAGCAWTAATATGWITIASGTSGTGPGTVLINVAANPGAARTGTVTIAGQTFTVTQAAAAPPPPPPPSCSYSINPSSQSIGALGGNGTIAVTTSTGCGWTAVSGASWIVVVSGTSGSGNGSASLAIAANLGGARAGTVTIAGQTYTVNQAAAPPPPPPPPPTCTYSLNPTSKSIGAGGATKQKVTVETTNSCTWTATSNASWLSIRSGASGQGKHEIEYDVDSNDGPARQGTLTIAGLTFTVNQAGHACSYSITPTSQSFSLLGGLGSVSVTATPGCSWTAASNDAWIIITLGGGGTGDGSVIFTVAPNVGGSRTGTITIAGRTFTVSQN